MVSFPQIRLAGTGSLTKGAPLGLSMHVAMSLPFLKIADFPRPGGHLPS